MADKENSGSFTSFSKITLGEIIKDLWGERVKHVKRGPRSDRKSAFLNIRRSEGGIRKSLGFALEEILIPQTWTRERVAPGHYIFSRREKNGLQFSASDPGIVGEVVSIFSGKLHH